MARAGLRKMSVCVIQLQGKSHRLNGAVPLQPLTGMPALSTRSQLGDAYSPLSPKWGRGAARLGGRVRPGSAAAAPSPGSRVRPGRWHSGTGVLERSSWTIFTEVTGPFRTEVC